MNADLTLFLARDHIATLHAEADAARATRAAPVTLPIPVTARQRASSPGSAPLPIAARRSARSRAPRPDVRERRAPPRGELGL